MALKTKKIFLINLILVIVFSISCKTSKSNMVKPKFVVNPMRVHNIELRRHQSIPIEYLKKNPSQKGLVLNHYLGTGKTFTSLAFCEEFPNEKTYIFAPNFLESNWLSHMDKMGIKDKSRYQFFSYERASKSILKLDLTNSIIIVDEVHRLIEKIKSGDEVTRKKYSKLYQKLRSAKKILALTGTPVFTEISDVAFLLNLVSGKDLLPFNDRLFNDQFTEVKKGKSFFRGHLSESHIWMIGLPFVLASLPLAFLTPSTAMVAGVYFGGLAAGFGILPLANALTPIEKSPMRKFKPGEIQDHAQKFISFYDFRSGKSEDYPQFKNYLKSVNYNDRQAKYMIDFADLALTPSQLTKLTREKSYKFEGDLKIESTPIQNSLRDWPDSGREIGNFSFEKQNGEVIESPKFEEILNVIGEKPESIVIYSSYFENGGLLFAEFLERKGKKEQFKILRPDLSVGAQTKIVNDYNAGKIPILILHPVYTEGLSLEGTQQLHILEPLPSQALNEQIIGRTIRFRSHAHLPKEKQFVNVYNWKSTLGFSSGVLERNDNWAKRFNELSSVASFGVGQSRIDPNFKRKSMSPDDFTDLKREGLKTAMKALEKVFKENSIERQFLN